MSNESVLPFWFKIIQCDIADFFFFFAYKGRIVEIVNRDDLHTEKCSFGEDDEH